MAKLRTPLVCLLLSLVALALPASATAQGFKWWQNDRFKRDLSLTEDQVTRIEEIFQALQPTFKSQKDVLDKQESRLSKVITDPASDEGDVLRVIERVESARSELSKSRTLMAFRIRRVLTDDQNARMKVLHDEWDRERRSRPPRPHGLSHLR